MDSKTKLEIVRGFNAGDYASAYESTDIFTVLQRFPESKPMAYRQAFIVGFFASYETGEIPKEAVSLFTAAYQSEYGQACVTVGYTDPRPELDEGKL